MLVGRAGRGDPAAAQAPALRRLRRAEGAGHAVGAARARLSLEPRRRAQSRADEATARRLAQAMLRAVDRYFAEPQIMSRRHRRSGTVPSPVEECCECVEFIEAVWARPCSAIARHRWLLAGGVARLGAAPTTAATCPTISSSPSTRRRRSPASMPATAGCWPSMRSRSASSCRSARSRTASSRPSSRPRTRTSTRHPGIDPLGILRAAVDQHRAHCGSGRRPQRRLDHHPAGRQELPASATRCRSSARSRRRSSPAHRAGASPRTASSSSI